AGTSGGDRPDVFGPFNKAQTLTAVVGWLTALGHRVVTQTAERVGLCRKGKDGHGESMNVEVLDGVPMTYVFSANAGLPEGRGLSPAMLRAFLEFGACDAAAMAKFASKLRGGDGRPHQILREYFRERYAPVYRDGLRAFCKDRGWVALSDVL